MTLAPLWLSMPFQSCETVWPLAKLQVRVQLVHAVVPVFWMVMAAPKALVFCGEIVYTTLHAVCALARGATSASSKTARTVMHPLNRLAHGRKREELSIRYMFSPLHRVAHSYPRDECRSTIPGGTVRVNGSAEFPVNPQSLRHLAS